jgi:hypothetical protein
MLPVERFVPGMLSIPTVKVFRRFEANIREVP